MLPSWKIISIILVLMQTICIAIDNFLLYKHKKYIHNLLYSWWIYLNDLNSPDFPKKVADWSLDKKRKIFSDNYWSLKFLTVFIPISCIITIIFISIGGAFDSMNPVYKGFRVFERVEKKMQKIGSNLYLNKGLVHKYPSMKKYFDNYKTINKIPLFIVLPLNFIFDLLTFQITYLMLKQIQKGKFLLSIFALAFDLLSAILLAIMCMVAYSYSMYLWFGFKSINIYTPIFVSVTTLIPTMLYIVLLFTLLIVKYLIQIIRDIIMYFTEVSTEKEAIDLVVFTLIGSILSIFAILCKLLDNLVTKYSAHSDVFW